MSPAHMLGFTTAHVSLPPFPPLLLPSPPPSLLPSLPPPPRSLAPASPRCASRNVSIRTPVAMYVANHAMQRARNSQASDQSINQAIKQSSNQTPLSEVACLLTLVTVPASLPPYPDPNDALGAHNQRGGPREQAQRTPQLSQG